jgi:hypothetical protein
MNGGDWFARGQAPSTRRLRARWVASLLYVIAVAPLGATARAQAPEVGRLQRGEVPDAVASSTAVPHASERADPGVLPGRPTRRSSLLVGASASCASDSRFADRLLPELGLYARLTDWTSIGMRLRTPNRRRPHCARCARPACATSRRFPRAQVRTRSSRCTTSSPPWKPRTDAMSFVAMPASRAASRVP